MAGSAGISRQTKNGAAEQLTEIAEFPAARESKQEMRKGLRKGEGQIQMALGSLGREDNTLGGKSGVWRRCSFRDTALENLGEDFGESWVGNNCCGRTGWSYHMVPIYLSTTATG